MSDKTKDANQEEIAVDDIVWIPAKVVTIHEPLGLGHLIMKSVHATDAYPQGTQINLLAAQVQKHPRGYVWEASAKAAGYKPEEKATTGGAGGSNTPGADSKKREGGSGT